MIFDKRNLIPWYMMIPLALILPEYHHDHETGITLVVKHLFGKTYILSEITTDQEEA